MLRSLDAVHSNEPSQTSGEEKDETGVSQMRFLKWWVSPTTIGFPTKNDHFGVFWGYHHLRKDPNGEKVWRLERFIRFDCLDFMN